MDGVEVALSILNIGVERVQSILARRDVLLSSGDVVSISRLLILKACLLRVQLLKLSLLLLYSPIESADLILDSTDVGLKTVNRICDRGDVCIRNIGLEGVLLELGGYCGLV